MASLLFAGVTGAPMHVWPTPLSRLSLCASNVVVPPVISFPENSSAIIVVSFDEQFPLPPVKVTVNVTGVVFGVIAPKVRIKSSFALGPTNPLIGVKVHPGAVNDMPVMPGLRHPIRTTNALLVPTGV